MGIGKQLILIVLLISSNFAYAGFCEDYDFSQLNLPDNAFTGCKKMPNSSGKAIVFIASPANPSNDSASDYSLEISVIDTNTNKVLSRLNNGKSDFASNIITAINIDTAPYHINRKQRAFGLRITERNFSRLNATEITYLNLYLETGNSITNILQGFDVNSSYSSFDDHCEFSGTTSMTNLSMAGIKESGFADISAITRVTTNKSIEIRGNCEDQEPEKYTKKSLLKYINGTYEESKGSVR
jgi:hypothetical protein